jgi:hypothetical protein
VAQIDTPLLTWFKITFVNQLIFHTPSLHHLISRTEKFRASYRAQVTFCEGEVKVGLYLQPEILSLAISCRPLDWQLSSVAQVCDSALPPLSTLERLEIYFKRSWKDDVENAQWLEFLRPFTSMKDLFLCSQSIPHVAPALEQLVGERATEVLPVLQNLFLEGQQPSGSVKNAIMKFIAARQLSDRPVSVYHVDWPHQMRRQVHWEVVTDNRVLCFI